MNFHQHLQFIKPFQQKFIRILYNTSIKAFFNQLITNQFISIVMSQEYQNKMISSLHRLLVVLQQRLMQHQYLSQTSLPASIDSKIFSVLKNYTIVQKEKYPHLFHWYTWINQFSIRERQSWKKSDESASDASIQQILRLVDKLSNEEKENSNDEGKAKGPFFIKIKGTRQRLREITEYLSQKKGNQENIVEVEKYEESIQFVCNITEEKYAKIKNIDEVELYRIKKSQRSFSN